MNFLQKIRAIFKQPTSTTTEAPPASSSALTATRVELQKVLHDLRNSLVSVVGAIDLLKVNSGLSERGLLALATMKGNSAQLAELVSRGLGSSGTSFSDADMRSILKLLQNLNSMLVVIRATGEANARGQHVLTMLGNAVQRSTSIASQHFAESTFSITQANRVFLDEWTLQHSPGVSYSVTSLHDFYVRGDEVSFSRILTNLTNNACRAILQKPDAKGRIDVTIDRADGRGIMKFTDTGIGMNADQVASIWNPGQSTQEGEGHGFGMTNIRELTESLGGSTSVESQPNVGTTFTLSFPLID